MGDGEFRALHRALADKTLVIGEVHKWDIVAERSMKSHRHYFACINEAWKNLPEAYVDDLPSPECLRKYALIKTGYARKDQIVCANHQEALNLLAAMRATDDYCIITLDIKVVTIWRAKSQNTKAMQPAEFQESKERTLHFIANLIGTDVETLKEAQAA
jgi:hypothetical protein